MVPIYLYLPALRVSLYTDGETMIQSRLYYARGLRLYGTHNIIYVYRTVVLRLGLYLETEERTLVGFNSFK